MSGMLATIRLYLELAYFAAGVIVSGGLIVTMMQLSVLKRDVRVRNERAAKERAIEAASRYLSDYTKLDGVLFRWQQQNKVKNYDGAIGNFTRKSINIDSDFNAKSSNLLHLPALNELEAIAAYFVSGVADEQTGFSIIGKTFCSTVEHRYDFISFVCEDENEHRYFSNIVSLYEIWRPRLTKADLENAKKAIDGKLSEILDTPSIKPIGI